jgi:hypothetical protein
VGKRQVGATSVCGKVLLATWSPCAGKSFGKLGAVHVDMPAATEVVVAASAFKLAAAGDGAAASPFGVATKVGLTVTVRFSDGSAQDYTDDPRTVYTVRAGDSAALVALSGKSSVGVKGGAAVPDAAARVYVDVSFVGSPIALVGSAELVVVKLAALALATQPYPAVAGWAGGDVTTLRQVACTGVWQRLEAAASGTLTDGTTVAGAALSAAVALTSSAPAVAAFAALCTGPQCLGLVPAAAGATTLTAEFHGVAASLAVTVEATPATLTTLTVQPTFADGTFRGVVGATAELQVAAAFSDGTAMTLAATGASSAWLRPSLLLSFASSQAAAVSVGAEGVATLRTNAAASVALTASDQCGAGLAASLPVFANLEPAPHDVDLGATAGAPLGPVAAGQTFSVPVRIQASSPTAALTAFQVVLAFSGRVVRVASDSDCARGSGWAGAWACTTNDPVNQVLIAGSCGVSASGGCGSTGLLTVATVTFKALAAGTASFAVHIVRLTDAAATTANTEAVAGSVTMLVTAGRRLAASEASAASAAASAAREAGAVVAQRIEQQRARQLAAPCSQILGDTNGDCVCDVLDVQYLQFYVGGSVPASALSAQQLVAMDPDHNGVANGVDVGYLMAVVANKFRFLKVFAAATPLQLSAAVLTAGSEPASAASTTVRFELGTAANQNMPFSLGTAVAATADGVVVTAAATAAGEFKAAGRPVTKERNIGAVVMIETRDANGATSADRQFAFYCTRLYSACTGVFGNTKAAFRPYSYVSLDVNAPPPTQQPTSLPTANDVVPIQVSLVLAFAAPQTISAATYDAMKHTISNVTAIPAVAIHGLVIAEKSVEVRRALQSTEYEWTIGFKTAYSLAASGAGSKAAFVSSVQSSLMSPRFVKSMSSIMKMKVTTLSVLAVEATQAPTKNPVKPPASAPAGPAAASANTVIVAAAVVGALLLVVALVVARWWSRRDRGALALKGTMRAGSDAGDDRADVEEAMKQAFAHAAAGPAAPSAAKRASVFFGGSNPLKAGVGRGGEGGAAAGGAKALPAARAAPPHTAFYKARSGGSEAASYKARGDDAAAAKAKAAAKPRKSLFWWGADADAEPDAEPDADAEDAARRAHFQHAVRRRTSIQAAATQLDLDAYLSQFDAHGDAAGFVQAGPSDGLAPLQGAGDGAGVAALAGMARLRDGAYRIPHATLALERHPFAHGSTPCQPRALSPPSRSSIP